MIKIRYLLMLLVFSAFLFSLFQVKFLVQELNKEAAELHKELQNEKDSIHVLKAEWAYLNQPERLLRLSAKYLNLQEVKPFQLVPTKDNYLITPKNIAISQEDSIQPLVKVSYDYKAKKSKNKKWNYRKRPTINSRPKK